MGRLALLLVAAGLLVLGSGAAVVYAQSSVTVAMREFAFDPSGLTVSAGRSTWNLRNIGQFPHNVHIEGNGVSMEVKPDGPVAGGQNFTAAVTLTPGTYDIWCPVGNHRDQGMVGTLTVAAAGAGGVAVQVPSALPRTGLLDDGLPIGQLAVAAGLVLIAAGLFVRRRTTVRR
jgi:plastocyanin